MPAVEAAHMQLEPNALTERREVGWMTDVGAVRGSAAPATRGATRARRLRTDDKEELAIFLPRAIDVAPGDGVQRQRHAG